MDPGSDRSLQQQRELALDSAWLVSPMQRPALPIACRNSGMNSPLWQTTGPCSVPDVLLLDLQRALAGGVFLQS